MRRARSSRLPARSKPRQAWARSLGRAQLASAFASALDFGFLVLAVEYFHFWYVAANSLGAALGATTNYMLGRHWSFRAPHESLGPQSVRYGFVSCLSLILNSGCLYLLKERLGMPYLWAKVLSSFVIGLGFNFPMHRNFVFRGPHQAGPSEKGR